MDDLENLSHTAIAYVIGAGLVGLYGIAIFGFKYLFGRVAAMNDTLLKFTEGRAETLMKVEHTMTDLSNRVDVLESLVIRTGRRDTDYISMSKIVDSREEGGRRWYDQLTSEESVKIVQDHGQEG